MNPADAIALGFAAVGTVAVFGFVATTIDGLRRRRAVRQARQRLERWRRP